MPDHNLGRNGLPDGHHWWGIACGKRFGVCIGNNVDIDSMYYLQLRDVHRDDYRARGRSQVGLGRLGTQFNNWVLLLSPRSADLDCGKEFCGYVLHKIL